MLNIVNQRNENQNHNEIYPIFVRMAIIIKNTNKNVCQDARNPCTLLEGM